MKAGLISIRTPHTDNIFSGRKTIEWRTKPLPTIKFFVYEPISGGGCGKVVGEIVIGSTFKIDKFTPELEEKGCVSVGFVGQYINKTGKSRDLYANEIVSFMRYETPKELNEFKRWNRANSPCTEMKWLYVPCKTCKECNLTKPPQNYVFVEE